MQTHPLQTRSHEPASDHTCASDRSATISQGSDGLEHLRRNQWHRTARPTAVVARPRGCIWRRDDAVVKSHTCRRVSSCARTGWTSS